jgi:hypothetical protein
MARALRCGCRRWKVSKVEKLDLALEDAAPV